MSYKIIQYDPYLKPFEKEIDLRMERLKSFETEVLKGKSLLEVASGHDYFGFHRTDGGWVYREWADSAKEMFLIGDFNNWQKTHPLTPLGNGKWEVKIDGEDTLKHLSRVKVKVISELGEMDRIPLYIKKVQQEEDLSFVGQVWDEKENYKFKHPKPVTDKNIMIYECHIGMGQNKEGIGTFLEFIDILPHIKSLGFNAIQIMGIMQHPYYGSFGYHVSNFFAVSHWFGDPNDLRKLIDEAHKMGLRVLLDVVHSHAVKNVFEGINLFDGTEYQFFSGDHPSWDSKLFDYSKRRVVRFLLSNLKFFLESYNFDGFRFDGITSMLYQDHGLGKAFTCYDDYFSMNTNLHAVNYLQLANKLIREVDKNAITISEDMSGMPGMCLKVDEGGLGFDYRLGMGVPDMWIKLTKDTKDEDWNMFYIYRELNSKRPFEKVINYSESHDQALVGDKTLIFRLMDKEMYFHMSKGDFNMTVDRGMALIKNINFLTALSGDGYLNFMGNEFGHPEWIDFPRDGNGWSYKYAKRRWDLATNKDLKYSELEDFSETTLGFIDKNNLLKFPNIERFVDNERKIIAFSKGGFHFIFNFHPNYSETNFFYPTHEDGAFKVVLTGEDGRFGGFGRVEKGTEYEARREGETTGFHIYSPSRSFIVLEKVKAKKVVSKNKEEAEKDKAPAKKAPAKKATAKKEPAKKTPAKKAPAKKTDTK